jgi:hypothetical protein
VRRASAAAALCAGAGLAAPALAEITYGVTANQTLVTFDSADPSALLSGMAIWGMQANERIAGIDFRPATGQLFALGSFNNLYTVDPNTGGVTTVGAGTFAPGLNGSSFGFDFNPTIDRIRVVSDANQNVVLNPNDGVSSQVTPVFYAAGDPNEGADPNVLASAYDNNVLGAVTSQLYGIDTGLDILVRQANSAGTLTTVGSLGVDLGDIASFDISGVTGFAYASVEDTALSRSTFWRIDLGSGAATLIGEIGGGAVVTSIAVAPAIPAPGVASLAGVVALVGGRRRRAR